MERLSIIGLGKLGLPMAASYVLSQIILSGDKRIYH